MPNPHSRGNLDLEQFDISEFRIASGHIKSPENFQPDKVKTHDFEVDLNLAFNVDERLVRATFSVDIETDSEGENPEEAFGSFEFVFIFSVENLEEQLEEDDEGNLQIDPFLGNAISAVTFSTSRGILMTRFNGTALQSFILPIINPDHLL